jgi:hypothetical protein
MVSGPPAPITTMEFQRQRVTAMGFAIFIAGIFLGTIFGFLIMALMTVAGIPSKSKRRQRDGVILAAPARPAARLVPRWGLGYRPQEFVLAQGCEKGEDSRLSIRVWQ